MGAGVEAAEYGEKILLMSKIVSANSKFKDVLFKKRTVFASKVDVRTHLISREKPPAPETEIAEK